MDGSENPQTAATTAVIKFVSRKEAEEAKSALNGEEVYGSLIKIEWARPYSPSLESDERYEVGFSVSPFLTTALDS